MEQPSFLTEPDRHQPYSHHQQRAHRRQFRPGQTGIASDRHNRTGNSDASRRNPPGQEQQPIGWQQNHHPSDHRKDEQRDEAQVAS